MRVCVANGLERLALTEKNVPTTAVQDLSIWSAESSLAMNLWDSTETFYFFLICRRNGIRFTVVLTKHSSHLVMTKCARSKKAKVAETAASSQLDTSGPA